MGSPLEEEHDLLSYKFIDPQGFIVDATIQRFAFTFELFWKTVKRYLLIQGFETKTPRETLQKAYKLNWIDDEELWVDMLADRNQTSHIYDQEKATAIYHRIETYFVAIELAFKRLPK